MLFSKNYISGEDAVGYNDASHIAILGMNLAEVTDIFLIQFRVTDSGKSSKEKP